MSREAVITGMGVVCPSGTTLEQFQENLWSGTISLELEQIKTGPDTYAGVWGGKTPDFNPADWVSDKVADGTDLAQQYALAAAEMARRDAGIESFDPRRTSIVSGSSSGGSSSMMHAQYLFDTGGFNAVPAKTMIRVFGNMAAAQMAMKWDIHGRQITLCHACATGVDVVGTAAELIHRGKADVVIAGGYDGGSAKWQYNELGDFLPAMKAAQVAYGMSTNPDDPHPSRPFDKKRSGVVAAEGAGFVIVESAEHAAARGKIPWAIVEGYGSLGDGFHPSSPEPTGRWEQEVMLEALAEAGLQPDDIDAIIAHGTSTVKGDDSEIQAINGLFGDRDIPMPVTSIKGHMGHPGSASGCLAVIAAALSMREGSLVHTAGTDEPEDHIRFDVVTEKPRPLDLRRVLVNAFGFGGQDACAIISAPGTPRSVSAA